MTKMAADKVPDKLPAIHEERSFFLNRGVAPISTTTRGKSQHIITCLILRWYDPKEQRHLRLDWEK